MLYQTLLKCDRRKGYSVYSHQLAHYIGTLASDLLFHYYMYVFINSYAVYLLGHLPQWVKSGPWDWYHSLPYRASCSFASGVYLDINIYDSVHSAEVWIYLFVLCYELHIINILFTFLIISLSLYPLLCFSRTFHHVIYISTLPLSFHPPSLY